MRRLKFGIAIVLAGFVGQGVIAAHADNLLSGSVFYRERMALPDNAELIVSVVDMAQPAADAVETVRVHPTGQVPIAFKLEVKPEQLATGTAYGVKARINVDGIEWFANSTPEQFDTANLDHPVSIMLTRSAPKSGEAEASAPTVLDTLWHLTTLGGQPANPDVQTTITFNGDGSVNGNGGCNGFGSQATFTGAELKLERAFSTMMACDEPTAKQEGLFFESLTKVTSHRVDGNVLTLLDATGQPIIGFTANP